MNSPVAAMTQVPTRVFPLPVDLAARARQILLAERRSAKRRQTDKRFIRGVQGVDLNGLFLNRRELKESDLTPTLRLSGPDPAQVREPGQMQQQPTCEDRSWLELATELHRRITLKLIDDVQFEHVLDEYGERGQIPDWLIAFASDHGQRVIDIEHVQPYRKQAVELDAQSRYYTSIVTQRPELAKYFVPLIAFELDESHRMCVMPLLENFVTLDELLLMAAGLRHLPGSPVRQDEAAMILPLVVAELAEILDCCRGTPSVDIPPWLQFRQKLDERFRPENETAILIGAQLLEDSATLVRRLVETRIEPLWTATQSLEVKFGHGDLNATNIMVAVQRDRQGEISSVCVRLIDANPDSAPGHALLELSRLVHWVELGMLLRFGRNTGSLPLEIHYSGSTQDEAYINTPPRLVLQAEMLDALGPVCEQFMTHLFHEFPALTTESGANMLSLGVGYYHLVATRFWSRNVDRTAAFWAGVNEFKRLLRSRTPVPDNGLWNVRHARRTSSESPVA